MQKTIRNGKNIFDENGEISFGGWSRAPLFIYNKEKSQEPKKLTEKDSYYFSGDGMGFFIEVETTGSELCIRLVLADFETGETVSDTISRKLLLDPQTLPDSETQGEFKYTDKKIALTLTNTIEGRYIKCDFIDFGNIKNLFVKLLVQQQNSDSMNMVAPFDTKKNFYYKRVLPSLTATGVVRFGGYDYNLDEKNSRVTYSRSRYSLPKRQNYQLMAGSFDADGHKITINLSSKVGNNRKGSENCWFCDGKLCKVGMMKVVGDEKDLGDKWEFESADGSLQLIFTPDETDGSAMSAKCDRMSIVFGKLSGVLISEDNKLRIENQKVHMIFANI